MTQARMARALLAIALTGISATALSEPVYLSCVFVSGAPFAVGSTLTFTFDESRNEVLLGNGAPAANVSVTPTEISFIHRGALNSTGPVPISIDRISGRFRTTVTSRAGEVPASGVCELAKKTMF